MNLSWSQRIAVRHLVITLSLSALFCIGLFVYDYLKQDRFYKNETAQHARLYASLYSHFHTMPDATFDNKLQGFWVKKGPNIIFSAGEILESQLYTAHNHPYFYVATEKLPDGSEFIYAQIPKNFNPQSQLPLFFIFFLSMGFTFFLVIQYFHRQYFTGITRLSSLKSSDIQYDEIKKILINDVFPTFEPLGATILKIVQKYHDSEVSLNQGKNRLQLALWAGESGLWEWDSLHDELYLSDSAKKLLALNELADEVVMNRNFLSYIHPQQRFQLEGALKDLLTDTNQSLNLEVLFKKEGKYEWYRVKGRVIIRDNNGKPLRVSGLLYNIQKKKDLLENLKVFENAFELIQESIMIIDTHLNITYVNESFEKTTGYKQENINNQPLSTLYSNKHEPDFYKKVILTLNRDGKWSGELWMQREDQSTFPEWLSLEAVRDKQDNIAYYIGVFTDLTQRKRQDDTLRYLSNFDPLTSLPNKNQFQIHLTKMIQKKSTDKNSLAVMIISIEELNKINETYGHMLTDYAIRVIAERFKSKVVHDEHLARVNGDEFGLIVDHYEVGSIGGIIDDFQKCVTEPIRIEEHDVVVSSAIGYSVYPRDAKNSTEIMKNAHSACIYAQQKGRNSVKEYDIEIDKKNSERKELEDCLRKALAKCELSIFYQPKVCLRTNKIIGSEALVRWEHEVHGYISPAVFVPLAEEKGLINLLGEWVLHEACRQNLRWNQMGFDNLIVGVNLSAGQFRTGDFAQVVAQALWDIGMPPNLLELELTESLVMEEPEKCKLMLLVLKKMGIKISIDDFGTGYSSLAHIREFPIDTLKIDRSFVKDLLVDKEAVSIINAIIAMAKSLKLNVIAEGVEHAEQVDIIRELGCDSMQGFYFAKALPADEFTELLKKNNS